MSDTQPQRTAPRDFEAVSEPDDARPDVSGPPERRVWSDAELEVIDALLERAPVYDVDAQRLALREAASAAAAERGERARRLMGEHPDDPRVVAARERAAQRVAELQGEGPERRQSFTKHAESLGEDNGFDLPGGWDDYQRR